MPPMCLFLQTNMFSLMQKRMDSLVNLIREISYLQHKGQEVVDPRVEKPFPWLGLNEIIHTTYI